MSGAQFKIGEEGPPVKVGDWDVKIEESIEKRITRWALIGAWMIISIVLGFLISTVWNLNGKIYEVAGKQAIQYEVIKELRDSKEKLDNENQKLKTTLSEKEEDNKKLRSQLNNIEMQRANAKPKVRNNEVKK